jgi:hypothetical protein
MQGSRDMYAPPRHVLHNSEHALERQHMQGGEGSCFRHRVPTQRLAQLLEEVGAGDVAVVVNVQVQHKRRFAAELLCAQFARHIRW